MISANEIQALLLGSGGFIGTCMAGVGAYRLFSAATRGVMRVPSAWKKAPIRWSEWCKPSKPKTRYRTR